MFYTKLTANMTRYTTTTSSTGWTYPTTTTTPTTNTSTTTRYTTMTTEHTTVKPPANCTTGEVTCSTDCSSMVLCLDDYESVTVSCAHQTEGRLPYCDITDGMAKCSTTSKCSEKNNCKHLKTGYYYPDLLDCTK